ncbi:hypothetical protein ACG3SL_19525 [Sphingomonas sp. CJ20]
MKTSMRLILILSTGWIAPAQAQTPANPATGKVYDWLNNRFDTVVQSCLAGATQIKLKRNLPGTDSKVVSAVPKALQRWVSDNGKTDYWALGPRDVSRQFGYVFTRADVESGAFPGRVERYLFAEYDQQAERMLLRGGVGEAVFRQTCDTAFKAAIESGIEFSGGTIEAAGKATSSGKVKNRVDVAAGTFTSPFVDAYRAPASTGESKAYIALIFWDWRARVGVEEAYLIPQFDGMALSRSEESDFTASVEANASANLGFIPFLTLRTKAEGRYSDSSNYLMKSFEVITTEALGRTVASRFEMPGEASLIAIIAQTTPQVSFGDMGDMLVAGLPSLAYVDVPAMPEKLCRDAGIYEAIDVSAGTVSIRSVAMRPDNRCRFTTAYTAPNSLTGNTADVSFKIHRRAAGLPSGMAGFHIPVPTIQFRRLDIPRLESLAAMHALYAIEPADPGAEFLVWQTNGWIYDNNQLAAGVVDTDLKLGDDCGLPLPYPMLKGEMMLQDRQAGRIGFRLTIRSRYASAASNDIRNPLNPKRACRVTGTLSYHIGPAIGGQTISRPLTKEIYLQLPDPVTAQEVRNFTAARMRQ